MENGGHPANSNVKWRHERGRIMQIHLTSPGDRGGTGGDTSSLHHGRYIPHVSMQHGQRQPLYKRSTTRHRQHHRGRLHPRQTTRTHNRSGTGHVGTFGTVSMHILKHRLHQTGIPHVMLLSTHSHAPCYWGSPIFPIVAHQPGSSSIRRAVQSLRRGLSTNPGVAMCVYVGAVEEMMCVVCMECYRGGIVVMDEIWRRLCVNMIDCVLVWCL